jgi:hypothetical protein
MPLPQLNQLPQQNDPYAMLQGYLSRAIPDPFAQQTNPKVPQGLQPPQQPNPQPNPIPTPAPTGGGTPTPQPGPMDSQRLVQALSLQALIAQLASPFAGATPMGFFSHPNQYASQYGMLSGNPNVAAMFDRHNVYKNTFENRLRRPDMNMNPWMDLRGRADNPNAGFHMDPNVLAQAAAFINTIIQSGGMMQGQPNA